MTLRVIAVVGRLTADFGRKPGTDVPDSLAFVLENRLAVLYFKLVFGTA